MASREPLVRTEAVLDARVPKYKVSGEQRKKLSDKTPWGCSEQDRRLAATLFKLDETEAKVGHAVPAGNYDATQSTAATASAAIPGAQIPGIAPNGEKVMFPVVTHGARSVSLPDGRSPNTSHHYPTRGGEVPDLSPNKRYYHNTRRGRTRTEMKMELKADMVPDVNSYDFDGDGVVGQRDWFVGRYFDVEKKGYLTASQRAKADAELRSGFLDRFKFGFDATGAANPEMITSQKAGKIITFNNMSDLTDAYPARYPPDHPKPRHLCGSEMRMDRVAMARNTNNDNYNRYLLDNPPRVKELVYHSGNVKFDGEEKSSFSLPPIGNIRERAQVEHAAARVRAGLLPVPGQINPEREDKLPGLGYQDKPQIAAISAIKAARKRCLKEDLVEQRKYGEENCITPRTRKSMYEQACHDFRKGDGPITKTRSVLLEQRRRDKIEYDRTYFAEYERTFPRYSDAEGYWWKKNRDYPPELAKPTRGDVIVPDLKVTEAVVPDAVEFVRPAGPADRLLGQTSSKGKQEDENPYASHAGMKVKESISLPPLYKKHYLGVPERNQKRLFDVIAEPNAKSNHLDDYCLDTHSSMRSVRENSREKKIRDRRQKGYNRGGVPGMVSELSPKHHNNASLTSTLTQNSQNGPENGQKQYSIYHRQDLSSTNSASGGNKNSSGGPNSGNNSGKGTRAASVDHNGTNRGSGGTRNTGTSNSGTISRQSWYLQGDSRKNSRKNSYAPTLLEQVGGVSHLGQYNSLNQSLDNALLENRSVVVSVANQPMQGSVDASRKTHVAGYGYYGNQSSNVSKQSAGGAHSNYLGNSYNYMSQHGPIVGGNSGSQQTLNLTGSQSVPNLGASVGATGVMTTKVSPPKKLNVVRKDTGGVPIMLGLAGYPGGAAAESGGAVRAPPHPDAMSPVAGGRGAKGRGRAGRAPSTRDPAKKEQEKPESTHYSDKRAPAVVAAKAVREGGFVHGAAIPANVSALVMDDGKHHPW